MFSVPLERSTQFSSGNEGTENMFYFLIVLFRKQVMKLLLQTFLFHPSQQYNFPHRLGKSESKLWQKAVDKHL